MKRKYGAAKKNESEAERMMRERAAERKDNSHNYGSQLRAGAVSRGKHRSRAARKGFS
jgi:hypothetical protein